MIRKIRSFFIIALTYSCALLAMDAAPKTVALLVVPGQNDEIGWSASNLKNLLQPDTDLHYKVPTPLRTPDFGQKRCMGHLKKSIGQMPETCKNNFILFGTSQGTATSINYLNTLDQLKDKKTDISVPKAIILQSVMLSGNSAIYHTLTKMVAPFLASLPGSYYLLPYVAKFVFPFYTPAGEQPIFNVDKISTNLPIIIAHCKNDKQLSYQDAQALYAELTNNGNNNVYLFSMPDSDGRANHFVYFDEDTKNGIFSILKKHNAVNTAENKEIKKNYDLSTYQPKVKQEWLDHFNNLKTKETRFWYFDKVLKATIISVIAYFMYTRGMIEKFVDKVSFNR